MANDWPNAWILSSWSSLPAWTIGGGAIRIGMEILFGVLSLAIAF